MQEPGEGLTSQGLMPQPLASIRPGESCVTLDHSNSWKVKDVKVEVGLVEKLWAFLSGIAVSVGLYESQGWEWTGLDKEVAPVSICVNWVVDWVC